MGRWDYTITERGIYVARRDGADAVTVAMLDDVELQSLRMRQWVAANDDLDELHEADATYRGLGWVSKAEHDFLWNDVMLRAHGEEPARRAALNDRWKADGLSLPLSRPDYDRWLAVMDVTCAEREDPTP